MEGPKHGNRGDFERTRGLLRNYFERTEEVDHDADGYPVSRDGHAVFVRWEDTYPEESEAIALEAQAYARRLEAIAERMERNWRFRNSERN